MPAGFSNDKHEKEIAKPNKSNMKKLSFILLITAMGCSSIHMVENWKNPDVVIFNANKVLLVGISNNTNSRTSFETKLQNEFEDRDIEAIRSLDVFDLNFTDAKRTEKELDDFEQSLLSKDFDAILLTKIIDTESKQSFRKSANDLNKALYGFNEDYRMHQDIFYENEYYKSDTMYKAETSLYCICTEKERSLIWRGHIDISDPDNVEKTIIDYVKLIIVALKEQDLIFNKEN